MCGISARIGEEGSLGPLLTSIKNLEYRGYDSAGVAIRNGDGVEIKKCGGEVAQLESAVSAGMTDGSIGIGHTRWSTHGPPTDENAHPHTDCHGRVAVVHNGIIENHAALREGLRGRGHEFTSDTDTEVIPHLIEERLEDGHDPETAFRSAVDQLEGSYAVAMVLGDEPAIYAARSGSPLVVGVGDSEHFLASDVPAFLEFTDRVVYLEDDDVVVLTTDGYRVTDGAGDPVVRPVETVDWTPEDAKKGSYDHFMLKEIHEQPMALRQTLHGRIDGDDVVLEDFPPGSFEGISRVQLVACGTSYHAGAYGEWLLSNDGIDANTFIASEYAAYPAPVDEETLVIGVTQSGETADTLEALQSARDRGARTLALTNVIGSTAARTCDDALFIRAGPEIGVAATKTFSSQVATLTLLAERLVRDVTGEPTADHEARLDALADLPEHVEAVTTDTRAEAIAQQRLGDDGHFFVGRGNAFSVALEGALKFKEITYEHAEGFAAGELKHGPLALVTSDTPVFAIGTGQHGNRLESNINEVRARGAPVVAVAPRTATDLMDAADEFLPVPATHPDLVAVLANVQLQLIAYHAADAMDRSIDKPRNLAKSVTVE
ncbi:glucosamine--fructose-6-phosphate aminotransferase (isomerizing) [Halorubrum xinjiangense]|uniref:Glutamine--fructose-6-phosphate aminotransferase [isomerizing] n=1 Tax=Halorubrum xinjiangense TaxID=261291 RepID=A0A1G7JQ91_9EURY|nr:glutamine--fructose-6-phosphate transaminase (isomerizing) [Halorubrum xinjiangense]SDF27035.1 glucosamine--fructose-6-phosphate aminotransferase (isomerizing) [Halorubrum xinjiangense]